MPTSHEYYTKHSRKVSASASQMSLPEQLQDIADGSATRSAPYLPATKYIESYADSKNLSDPFASPDSFYQYPTQYAQSSGAPLRQGAIRPIDVASADLHQYSRSTSSLDNRHGTYANGFSTNGSEHARPHMNSPGLRGRKSSVKNLVEQINATANEGPPPLPSYPRSGSNSRNISPVISSQAQFQQQNNLRQLSGSGNSLPNYDGGHMQSREVASNRFASDSSTATSESLMRARRPLFGEIVQGPSVVPIPGYGIHNFRHRSGSEGSPLPSPHLVQAQDPVHASHNDHAVDMMSDANFTLSPAVYIVPNKQSAHRRANSESPLTPTRLNSSSAQPHLPFANTQNKSIGPTSRIPVSVRRESTSSDYDKTNNLSSLNAKQDVLTQQSDRQRTPRRRERSPPAIQSPGQRGKNMNINQGSKSPLLRANIIVPPPKISPALRSSRPRLPVSSASTTASRAKMAEKFNALQKMNDEKRQADRRLPRPPELSDIDLKARRLRITQALTKSLEGQDLKGTKSSSIRRDLSASRTASPALSNGSDFNENHINSVPAVVARSTDSGGFPGDLTPIEIIRKQERSFSHNALEAMQGTARSLNPENDSPTLGPSLPYSSQPAILQTNIQRANHDQEPSSAITEGTMIDPDPQDDLQQSEVGRTVLSQIASIRSDGNGRESSYGTSERGDQESIQIVLRNTMYLDEEEAVRKGYRHALPNTKPDPQESETDPNQRSSWISSVDESDEDLEGMVTHLSEYNGNNLGGAQPQAYLGYDHHDSQKSGESVRSTARSDAYTIVNMVLQQHSTAGVVDQQFVDDVYQRIIEDLPVNAERGLSADQIEQICLQEIEDREQTWSQLRDETEPSAVRARTSEDNTETPTTVTTHKQNADQDHNSWLHSLDQEQQLKPPPPIRHHRYKSSLDSAEDWLDTSPSLSDWMRYAVDSGSPQGTAPNPSSRTERIQPNDKTISGLSSVTKEPDVVTAEIDEDPELYSGPAPPAPTHDPPPLPSQSAPSVEAMSGPTLAQRPQIPRRVTSISQIGRTTPRGRESPSISAPVLGKVSTEEAITPEQRRLKQRKNVIKELVDTEFSYEKDLRVLCDIYKQTASVALGEEDIRVLFGNIEQVQIFSKDFLMLLKSLAKPTYTMERQDRKRDKGLEKLDGSLRPKSSSSTLASNRATEIDLPTPEKDRETRLGQAFEASLADMERVYTEYIKNRHAANLRLEAIQKSHGAREWLKECKENSSDITNAWNLDALLVKPVQRITKYPLLLKELVDSTSEDHPDLQYLRRAVFEITEVNIRINDVKKHAELVDQVLNRKRKDSDVRAGLSKAFGRRAEKLKQHVGITELFEDSKYNEIKIHYDNNIVQLMVVGNDCSSYGRAITKWVNKMVEIAAAAEAWVDVGHSNHQEAESRLRQFAMVVRGISTIALPDHLEHLNNKILTPMQQAVDLMTKFKNDPKGLLQKREKRMIDYAQIKSKKDRGEKIDRKMVERMEQSEALNVEAKQRMRKLVAATATLVQACQANLIQMQVTWQNMVRTKLSAAMGISSEQVAVDDITKEWQLDFDYQEACALSFSICNGSLLAEAVNMVNFQTSNITLNGTTLNGDESPRQASFTSASKRSISLASENSHPPIPEYDPRVSGTYGHQFHEHSIPYANARVRAQSAASTKYARTPEIPQPMSAGEGYAQYTRHESAIAPRLSIETQSPLSGILPPEQSSRRPVSSSTFFSASGTPPPSSHRQVPHHQHTGSSSIFSSAMPMSDTAMPERYSETGPTEPEILFTAASVYEFNIDRSRREAGFPYLTYVTGEIFDVIGERGELWLAKNQDDPHRQVGWIWNKHFAKLAI